MCVQLALKESDAGQTWQQGVAERSDDSGRAGEFGASPGCFRLSLACTMQSNNHCAPPRLPTAPSPPPLPLALPSRFWEERSSESVQTTAASTLWLGGRTEAVELQPVASLHDLEAVDPQTLPRDGHQRSLKPQLGNFKEATE